MLRLVCLIPKIKKPSHFFVIEENPTYSEKTAHHEAREQLSIW